MIAPPKNRILFHGNPWPNGHAIDKFFWRGRLQTDGTLWFDLYLQTADYYAEDPDYWTERDDDDSPDSDWLAKIVWGNFHRCTMASDEWHDGGWQVGSAQQAFDWSHWQDRRVHLDPADSKLPEEESSEERAFHIYLLGHDAVADHHLHFQALGRGLWDIHWEGKIALAYIGHYDLAHRFSAKLTQVAFKGFSIPEELSDEDAWALFARLVSDWKQWRLSKHRFDPKLRYFVPE